MGKVHKVAIGRKLHCETEREELPAGTTARGCDGGGRRFAETRVWKVGDILAAAVPADGGGGGGEGG